MKLNYSQESILNGRKIDKFFVDYSLKDLDNNLLILGQLHLFGNHLKKVLDEGFEYRIDNLQNNFYKCKDYVGNIKKYSLLAEGLSENNYHYYGDENSFRKDYKIFKNDLIKNIKTYYLHQFSIEKLADSFLNFDDNSFQKQKIFFKIDLFEIPMKIILKKDKEENLPDYNSYIHLYNLFLNHISRYKDSNLESFTEMGMSIKQKEHCDLIYTKKVREKSLTDEEIKKLLKKSIIQLIKKIYL